MFGVTHPKTGQTVELFRYKFAASGRGESGHHPLVGVLKGSAGDALVVGRTLREPRNERLTWTMVFDLEEILGLSTDKFTLSVFRLDGESDQLHRLGDPVTDITFRNIEGTIAPRAVDVTFPDPSTTHCRFGFTAYGLLTDPDTRLESAELENESDSSTIPADFIDSDNEGFWVATFDELSDSSTTTYKFTAFGNATFGSVAGLTFLGSECS